MVIDVEPIQKGEDEVKACMRLFKRVIKSYPKAFDVVTLDSLYARENVVKFFLKHKKDVVIVIKDERREAIKDAIYLFKDKEASIKGRERGRLIEIWDEEGFTSWDSLGMSFRVVYSRERYKERGKEKESNWYWMTTLSKEEAKTEEIWRIGHKRWVIENNAFKEGVELYNIDHCFVHNLNAIFVLLLTFAIADVLLKCFYNFSLKAEVRKRYTFLQIFFQFTCSLIDYLEGEKNKRSP